MFIKDYSDYYSEEPVKIRFGAHRIPEDKIREIITARAWGFGPANEFCEPLVARAYSDFSSLWRGRYITVEGRAQPHPGGRKRRIK